MTRTGHPGYTIKYAYVDAQGRLKKEVYGVHDCWEKALSRAASPWVEGALVKAEIYGVDGPKERRLWEDGAATGAFDEGPWRLSFRPRSAADASPLLDVAGYPDLDTAVAKADLLLGLQDRRVEVRYAPSGALYYAAGEDEQRFGPPLHPSPRGRLAALAERAHGRLTTV